MTMEDFLRLYPISRSGFAKMLGTTPKFISNATQRHTMLPDEQIAYFIEAIKEIGRAHV